MEKFDDGTEHETWHELTEQNRIPNTWNDDRAGGKGHYVPEPADALKNKRKDKSGTK
jgi:dihydropyrimidine dehydrogenase (NAD+) subunit PreA